MGKRGPMPKSGSRDTLLGINTFKKSSTEPIPVHPPALVLADEVALKFWHEHAPPLIESRRLRPEQAHSLGLLCCLHSEIIVLSAGVASAGHVIDTQRGPIPNPAAKMLRDSRRDFVALAREFGLTAASEARLPENEDDDTEDPLDEFA